MRWNLFQKRRARRSAAKIDAVEPLACRVKEATAVSGILSSSSSSEQPRIAKIDVEKTPQDETDGTDSISTLDPEYRSGCLASQTSVRTFPGSSGRNKHTRNKNVCFDTVETRVYKRIVGDHPCTEIPLSISWEYTEGPRVSVATQESETQIQKPKELQSSVTPAPEPTLLKPIPGTTHESPGPAMKILKRVAAAATTHHKSANITNKSNLIEPISLEERVYLLRSVSGYTLVEIQRAERRRKVQAMMEWAYRVNRDDDAHPCSIENCEFLYNRYIR